jgi:hypothetical protein
MKKFLSILVLAIALIGLNACAEANASEQKKETKVYICTGKYAKRYHRYSDCKGLGSCKGEIRLVPISTAKKQGKTPCGYCY